MPRCLAENRTAAAPIDFPMRAGIQKRCNQPISSRSSAGGRYDTPHGAGPVTDDSVSRRIRNGPLPDEFPGVHCMDEEEVEAAVRVIRSRSLYRYYGVELRREADSFEQEFARYLDIDHVVAVTSGTAALHTALATLRVGPGMEVIVPAYMWVSVIAAVVNLGAIPVLADIDESFGLDPEDVRRRITPRTAGIIAVHMNGAPAAHIEALVDLAQSHDLFLLEDCAQCVGGSVDGRKVGTFGDMAIFSFQINKNMSVGEAGAVVTSDEALYRRAVAVQDAGYARSSAGKLEMNDSDAWSWGRGVRIDELRSAILRVQLRKLEGTIERMRHSKGRIVQQLASRPELTLRRLADPAGDTGGFLLTIFPDEATARAVNQRLRGHGIVTTDPDTSNVILADYGMHIYSNIPGLVQKIGTDNNGSPWTLAENRDSVYSYNRGACPRADGLFGRTQMLAIPSCLTRDDEDDIIRAFHLALDEVFAAEPAAHT